MYFPPNRKSLHTIEVNKKSKKKDSRMHKQREIQKTGLSISIASEPIKEVTEAKFLGVWFDPMLIWNVHIRNIRNKLVSSIAIIKRILPFIPKTNHKSIYHTLFESHLAYTIFFISITAISIIREKLSIMLSIMLPYDGIQRYHKPH